MKVLDQGAVELKEVLASDFSVVAAARVSHGASWEDASKGKDIDEKLINFLMRNKHGSPFEHNMFSFFIDCPLFVRSEWHRHRIGWSYNEISRRYTTEGLKFYLPKTWRVQAASNRQASEEAVDKPDAWHELWTEMTHAHVSKSLFLYEDMLANDVARELARMVLPQNLYTQFYATCNARSLMNFIALRNHPNAQQEIREYAAALEDYFQQHMPLTYAAFLANERVAP